MPIEYIDALNNSGSIKQHVIISLDDLILDKRNPRFSSSTIIGNSRHVEQADIIKYLLQFGDIVNLAESINKNHGLYDEEWISCYKNEQNEIIVLEGNRRITACKILKNEFLIPEEVKSEFCIPSVDKIKTLPNICKIKAIIYENEQDAQTYIAAKHTKPEVKKWETIEQCNYYYDQFIRGIPLLQIGQNVGEDIKKVQEKIKQFGLFKQVFDVVKKYYPEILIEEVNILPLVTKFFPPIISPSGKVGLNLTLDKESLTYYPAPEKADIFHKILLKIGEAFFIRPKPKISDIQTRSLDSIYRISTDEIKSKAKVEELIIDDKRIVGLYDLIKKYNQETTDNLDRNASYQNEGFIKTAADTPAPNAMNETPVNNHNYAANSQEIKSRDKVPEFFSDLRFNHLNKSEHLGLVLICDEIQKISSYNGGAGYKQFPIASAFLLRSLIEQLLSERLKQKGRYDGMVKVLNDGSSRSPELGNIISVFLKDCQNKNLTLFWDDGNLAREFNKCFSGYGTKDQLDTIIHNPHLLQPDHNFLNSFSKQGLKHTLQLFLDKI